MVTQAINQFGMLPLIGSLDEKLNWNTIPVMIDPAFGGTVAAGTPCKLVTTTPYGVPVVTPVTALTDVVFCFINYSTKQSVYNPGDNCQGSASGNVMYLQANGAITRGARIAPVIASPGLVVAAATGNNVAGWAFDGATGAGQMIRVMIKAFGQTPETV